LIITFKYIVSCNYLCTWVNFVLRLISAHVGVCNCYESILSSWAQCIYCLIAPCSSLCHFVFKALKHWDEWQKLASFAPATLCLKLKSIMTSDKNWPLLQLYE
jgi:hypothetical protein